MDTQRRMDEERERMRLDGLRRLARIIARHALAQPHLYGNPRGGDPPQVPASHRGPTEVVRVRRDGAA